VCTSSSRSCMSSKDLVCCLALIYYGTQKERMQREICFSFIIKRKDCIDFYLVLYLLFTQNVSNSNGALRWQDVEDFLSQCGDHPPEELDTIFQNVCINHISQVLSDDKNLLICRKGRYVR
jgi:hypothetical protein